MKQRKDGMVFKPIKINLLRSQCTGTSHWFELDSSGLMFICGLWMGGVCGGVEAANDAQGDVKK